jgi:hypothetical protein
MPSAFIKEQAELLHRTKDTFGVLQQIRDKYALSSFPSQMSRVKEEWYKYEDRHERFDDAYNKGLKSLVAEQVSSRFLSQYKEFRSDGMKDQLRKSKLASAGTLTGSRRADRAIAKIPIIPEYMFDYKLTKDDISKNNARSEKCLEKRAMACVVIEDGDKLVSKCRDIIRKLEEDVFLVAAAIAVLCGRRSIEIIKIGKFRECPRRGCHSALFEGAAKKRGVRSKAIEIPLLVKYKYLEPAVDHVRKQLDAGNMTNSSINSKYSHKLGDAAKLLTERLDTRFHDLRAVYGCITHQLFSNTCSINIWLKKVLMHDNIDTSVFYSRCKVSNCKSKLGEWKVK